MTSEKPRSLTELALLFGPPEYFSLIVLALVCAVALAQGSIVNALAMIVLGLLLGLVGTDTFNGTPRFTFDLPELADGIGVVAVGVGVFGLAEILRNLEDEHSREAVIRHVSSLMLTREDVRRIDPDAQQVDITVNQHARLAGSRRCLQRDVARGIDRKRAGVIVRTAAEAASEEELTRDVERLKARWEDIEKKAKGSSPQLLYGEPDLTHKVVRDLFTEDFSKLVIEGGDAWDTVQGYVAHVAPDLEDRLEKYDADGNGKDVFAAYRIDEQIAKGLDRKVWLPSGGSLIIDRTEAMTVIDVNTGKFTGSGGNLEETVTKNNLEAAEEIVRQLRLRDIGGIIVIDFIDMVLESNRELVLRRLLECLGRDRTKHQVAEITSLGLVQMTRKRVGQGLLEAFSEPCDCCNGRGSKIHMELLEPRQDTGRRRRARADEGQPPAEQVDGSGDDDEAAIALATGALATAEEPVAAGQSGGASLEGSVPEEGENPAASAEPAVAGESGGASLDGSAPDEAEGSLVLDEVPAPDVAFLTSRPTLRTQTPGWFLSVGPGEHSSCSLVRWRALR